MDFSRAEVFANTFVRSANSISFSRCFLRFEVKVRKPDACRSCKTFDCIRGGSEQRGCELKLFQPKKKSNVDCTFCLDCVHACPHDNVGLLAVIPGKDLWNGEQRSSIGPFANRFDLAVLVLILVFGALTNAAGMIAPVSALLERAQFLFDLQRPDHHRFVPFGRNFTDPGIACLHGRVSEPDA